MTALEKGQPPALTTTTGKICKDQVEHADVVEALHAKETIDLQRMEDT